jgi:DNA-binding NtrC family response regulator
MEAVEKRGTVLFVDDEQRVLTSMRAMFRREYEVLLANSGTEALDLLRDRSVDVIVSDQRMPGMTGVEVLKAVKRLAPNAMRILLTGYADLKAIEASINEGEVFRYLTKPCPSEQLKDAIGLAVDAAIDGTRDAPAPARERASDATARPPHAANAAAHADAAARSVPTTRPDVAREAGAAHQPQAAARNHAASRNDAVVGNGPAHTDAPTRADAASRSPTPSAAPVAAQRRPVLTPIQRRPAQRGPDGHVEPRPRLDVDIRDIDVLVLTHDALMVAALETALDGSHRLHRAKTLDEAVAALERFPVGVMLTDTAVNESQIATLTTTLKRHVPELVTIVASARSDAQMLIDLINYGQIFRFLLKPLHSGQCRLSVESAVQKHRELTADPSARRRHLVVTRETSDESVLSAVFGRIRRLRDRFLALNGMA